MNKYNYVMVRVRPNGEVELCRYMNGEVWPYTLQVALECCNELNRTLWLNNKYFAAPLPLVG